MMLLIASPSNAMKIEFSDMSSIIEAVAATANLILVIYFFYRERKEYQKREEERIQEQAYVSWYNLLIRERMIDEIDKYFLGIETIVHTLSRENAEEQKKTNTEYITNIKNLFSISKRIFLPTLGLFSSELKKDVWDFLQENHDQILESCEYYMIGTYAKNTVYEIINEAKANTLKLLYEFDLEKLKRIHK